MVIYDIEIKKAILGKNSKPVDGVQYCEGWNDHENMGISCVCAYDYVEDRYRVFMEDNMEDFMFLVEGRSVIVGFNNIGFDNKVLAYVMPEDNGTNSDKSPIWAMPTDSLEVKKYLDDKSYDILAEIRTAGGGWCNLDAMVKVNDLGLGKTGNGATAPVWYQEKRCGKLIDYCLADAWNTKKLLDKIMQDGSLVSSKTGQVIDIKKPLR